MDKYDMFGNGTHWFGANAKLIHPTAVSKQQLFRITLSRMRYGEGMVVVKEVMEAMIMGQRIFHYRIYALQALGQAGGGKGNKFAAGAKAFVAQTCAVIFFGIQWLHESYFFVESRVCNECTIGEEGPVVFLCEEDGNDSISISSLTIFTFKMVWLQFSVISTLRC
ncbi:Uncharacterized protein Rs2_35794 [Raphanus sativus]|nr:Uncharacterized protein Rs2_35794 [Raphanus sativus]